MNYFIGADLGTSALKLLLLDESGTIIKTVTRSYPVSFPAPGWSEQSPEDWWDAFVSGVRELTEKIAPAEIAAIGLGGQMHGLVALDSEDRVIRPAILWNDGRTDKETAWLNSEIGKEKLSAHTANIAFAGFTAPKLLWMQEAEPEHFERISKIMLPKDYINYRLTGVHCTDYSDASGMLLLDVENRAWSKEMLEICHIREEQMPTLYESHQVVGRLTASVAELLGLSEHTLVVAGAGDNAAAAIGTGTVGEGKCNISLGTSGTIFISSESFSVDPYNALHSFCHADGGYHLMGCILSAASCNKWFCEDILGTDDYAAEQAKITEDQLGQNFERYREYMHNQIRELLTNYGKIDVMWFDFSYGEMTGEKWGASEIVKMARELQPDIIIDNRLGGNVKAEEPEDFAGDYASPEQMIPVGGVKDVNGNPIPWETCITLNDHWCYVQRDKNFKSAKNVINMLMECVSNGGNLLLNVGPNAKGEIPEESVKILEEVGEWMHLNGEAVYGCGTVDMERPSWGRVTRNEDAIYLYVQDTCSEYIPIYDCPEKIKCAALLADGSEVKMQLPWNAESYELDGKKVIFVRTPMFADLNGNKNVIKLFIEK